MGKTSESKIDRLRKRVNSQNEAGSSRDKGRLSARDGSGIRKRWEHNDPPPPQDNNSETSPNEGGGGSFLNKFLVFSGLFFLAAFAFAMFSVGNTGISPDKINIDIAGPQSISAGDTVSLDVDITNRNEVTLQQASLVVEYPAGTRNPNNSGEEIRRTRQEAGTLAAGETLRETIEANIFGSEGEEKSILVQFEYEVADSNAIFTASNTHELEVTESPVSVDVQVPDQVTAGETFSLTADVQSNSSRMLEDVLLVTNYPFGFEVQDVDPQPSYRQYVWQLGDLSPGDEEAVEITGAFMDNSAGQDQTFRFDVGSERTGEATEIGALYASQDVTTSLEEAFINLDLNLDAEPDNNGSNLEVSGGIDWSSNLDSAMAGGEVTVALSGEGVDYDSFEAEDGLYNAASQTITYNARTDDRLENIAPGDNGSFQFDFSTSDSVALTEDGVESPVVGVNVDMEAQTPDSDNLPNPVMATINREIQLPTVVQLTADTLYEDGPFTNTGPVPPEIEESTTYTLHISLANTTNEVTDGRFQAVLPAYVELAGDPESVGNFSYNSTSGRLSWDIGRIAAGAGYQAAPKEIFIPVRLTPTRDQVNSTLPLLEDLSVTGTDSSTGSTLQVQNITAPTTQLDDLRANGQSGRVQEAD